TLANAGEGVRVIGSSTGSANLAYTSFYDSDGSTRRGLVGDSNASDTHIRVQADTSGANVYLLTNAGTIKGSVDSGTTLVDMTPASGTFTATGAGFSSPPTGTATWYKIGNSVTLNLPALSGTSNSTSFTITGLPAAIQPATLDQAIPVVN